MLACYGLVQVFRVEAYVHIAIGLTWIGEGRYLLSRLGDRHDHTFLHCVIKGALDLFPVLNRYLPLGMLDRACKRVSPDGVGPRHVAYSIEGVWEGLLQGNNVLHHCG